MKFQSTILVAFITVALMSAVSEARSHAKLRNKKVENEVEKPKKTANEEPVEEDKVEVVENAENKLASMTYYETTASNSACAGIICENGGTCLDSTTIGGQCWCRPFNTGSYCQLDALIDVARSDCGATCTASSELGPCQNCIDGDLMAGDWYTFFGETNSWIDINFVKYYFMVALKLRQRCHQNNQNRQIGVQYSDGSETMYELACHDSGFNDFDCVDTWWQNFDLEPKVSRSILINVYSVCRQYAYNGFKEIKLYAYDVALVNVGSALAGATCNASSVYNPTDYPCEGALDGETNPALVGSEWASDGEGVGAWIDIFFDGTYDVVAVDMLPRCDAIMHMWRVLAEFSGGESYQINMVCGGGAHIFDCDGQEFQTYQMAPAVTANSVRLTITNICVTENNQGFREVQIFAIATSAMRSLERQHKQYSRGVSGSLY